jgi:transposase InsO family protein
MKKNNIKTRIKKRKYRYAGRAEDVTINLANLDENQKHEIIFSDIFEFYLSDKSKVYCCFIIRKYTRQILSFSYGYSMQATLVEETLNRIDMLDISNSELIIFHSDQGSQYGSKQVTNRLKEVSFVRSMSRAGTPTDNAIAERFVGTFKHAVVDRYSYGTIGDFLHFAEQWLNFYNNTRPHQALKMKSPNTWARDNGFMDLSYLAINCV